MLGKIFYNIIVFGTIISICIFPLLMFLSKNKYKYSFKSLYKIFVFILIILILPINIFDFSKLKMSAKKEIKSQEEVVFHEPEIKFESENTIIEIDDGISIKNNIFFNFSKVIPYIWFGVAILKIIINLISYLIFLKNQRINYISDTNIEIDEVIKKLCNEMEIKNVEYRISNDISTPMTIGILSKKIIFPKQILENNEYEFIIKHELFHIKNKDIEYKFLLLVLSSIYWFNPIIYLFVNQVDEILELNCDEYVLQGKEQACRIEYAEILLNQIEKNRNKEYKFSMNFANRRKNIMRRFSSIVDKSKKKSIISITTISIILIAISLVLVLCIPNINFASIQENILENTVTHNEVSAENNISLNKVDDENILNNETKNELILNEVTEESTLIVEQDKEKVQDENNEKTDNNKDVKLEEIDNEKVKTIDYTNTKLEEVKEGKEEFRIGYPFKDKNIPISTEYCQYKAHTGIDLATTKGTEILATASGKVILSEYKGSYGNLIIIQHDNEIQTYYAHCSELLVKEGDEIKKGDVIGKTGATGNATGPCLHLELRKSGVAVDPKTYMDV